ncbi:Extended synaptotagmin-2 [Lamellibrachia satsuma]|nr:Extended synaptotagmin-2 [Lamellibrachia satsuma]
MSTIKSRSRRSTGSLSEAVEEHMANGLLVVTVDSASGLKRLKKMLEPTAYVRLSIGNKEQKTAAKAKTTNPKWEEHLQFLIHNPSVQELDVTVFDSGKGSKRLGTVTVSIKDLLNAKDMTVNRPFPLRDAEPQSKINLQLCLRILTPYKPANWAQDTVFQLESTPSPEEAEDEDEAPNSADSPVDESGPQDAPVTDEPDDTNAGVEGSLGRQTDDVVVENIGNRNGNSRSSTATPERPVNQELRHRGTAKQEQVSESDADLGRIQLTVRYSAQRNRLVAVVHKCVGLLACDADDMSDPYVRLYLLPDRSSATKKKTQTVRNNLSPVFDETFEWPVSVTEASMRTLEIGVKNAVGVFSKSRTHIGQVHIDLSEIDLSKATTDWYVLADPDTLFMSLGVQLGQQHNHPGSNTTTQAATQPPRQQHNHPGSNTTTQAATQPPRQQHNHPGSNTTTQAATQPPRQQHNHPGSNTTTQAATQPPRQQHNHPGTMLYVKKPRY